jgi:rRNA maturation endonuclease Nob1
MSEQQTIWAPAGANVGAKNFSPLQASIALSRAMICVDCDRIFEATRDGRCPLCGSSAAVPIGRWLPSMAGR